VVHAGEQGHTAWISLGSAYHIRRAPELSGQSRRAWDTMVCWENTGDPEQFTSHVKNMYIHLTLPSLLLCATYQIFSVELNKYLSQQILHLPSWDADTVSNDEPGSASHWPRCSSMQLHAFHKSDQFEPTTFSRAWVVRNRGCLTIYYIRYKLGSGISVLMCVKRKIKSWIALCRLLLHA
jgi:hypothetical protein